MHLKPMFLRKAGPNVMENPPMPMFNNREICRSSGFFP
jgi:hypothetical protein